MVYDVSALTTDFYELTMMQGYYLNNENPDVVFDILTKMKNTTISSVSAAPASIQIRVRALA